MIYLSVVVGVVLICVLLGPFFLGNGGLLQASSSINSPVLLAGLKTALLKRYLEDEASFKAGALSNVAWGKRKAFLTHRYLDAARRLDFLEGLAREGGAA